MNDYRAVEGISDVTMTARVPWVDQVKVLLVSAVIVTHCALTYGANGSWFYHEQGAPAAMTAFLKILIALGALFAMGAFFFLAGCFVPDSLTRKGPTRFAADRLLRLGIPVAAFVLVVVPLIEWWVSSATGGRVQVVCRRLLAMGCLVVIAVLSAFREHLDPFGGCLHWQSGIIAVLEGVICVSATVTLLDLFASGRADAFTAHQVLRAATLAGAKAAGLDDRIGSIVPGKAADLTAFDLSALEFNPIFDVASHLIFVAGREAVSDVWVAGNHVVQKRQFASDGARAAASKGASDMTLWQNRTRSQLDAH